MARRAEASPPGSHDSAAARAAARSAVPLPESPRVLLLVDVINPLQFEGAQALARHVAPAVPRLAALKQRLRRQGVATVYANDNFGDWHSDFDQLVDACRAHGGTAAQLAQSLAPERGDITVLKPRYSAFLNTPLHGLLQQMGTRELVIAGFATDLCVLMSAADAYQRGFALHVPADACAAQSRQRHEGALHWMQRALKASVTASVTLPASRLPSARQGSSTTKHGSST